MPLSWGPLVLGTHKAAVEVSVIVVVISRLDWGRVCAQAHVHGVGRAQVPTGCWPEAKDPCHMDSA